MDPENIPKPEAHKSFDRDFSTVLRELLPDFTFEETSEMFEARVAIREALKSHDSNSDLIRLMWAEYADICEAMVDDHIQTEGEDQRAQLQIGITLHKGLIFRNAGNIQRYIEELIVAEEYAFQSNLDEIATAIGAELDGFC